MNECPGESKPTCMRDWSKNSLESREPFSKAIKLYKILDGIHAYDHADVMMQNRRGVTIIVDLKRGGGPIKIKSEHSFICNFQLRDDLMEFVIKLLGLRSPAHTAADRWMIHQ